MGNQGTPFSLPGYRIDRILGKGGMATVYLGTQISLDRPVALKILNDPETPQFFERFFNEGRYVARLSHSNLVTIFDIGQGDGFYYIVMEYLPGGDLKSRIAGGLKPGSALKILSRLANCLGYVHGKGVVHRDIKPSNILFRADGTPVLTDFGIAKLIQADNDLTVTGTVMGSPHYLSPEQAQGSRRLDGRSDLYSLGIILYEMLTGRKPYSADGFAAVLMAHIKQPVPRLPEPLQDLQPLIDRLLAKDPNDRFQSGAEVVKGIQQWRQKAKPRSTTATPGAEAGSGTTPPLLRPAIGLALAGLLGAGLLSYGARDGTTPAAAPQPPALDPTPLAQAPAGVPEETYPGAPEAQPLLPETASEGVTGEPLIPIDGGPDATGAATEDAATVVDTGLEDHGPETAPPASVSDWLLTAEQRYRANKLGLPRGDSARDWYRRVLKRDPGNPEAEAGLKRIAGRYAWLARNRIQEQELERARHFVRQGLETLPREPALIALSRELDRREQAREHAHQPPLEPPPAALAERPVPALEPEPDPFAMLNPGDR